MAEPPGVGDELLARVVIERADGSREVAWLTCEGVPDLTAVDTLARLQLACRRAGDRLHLERVSEKLEALLELSGLFGQFERQTEGGEEPLRFQEGVDTGDTVA
jgi:ABC-type transporter Mla MlaB component